MALVLCFHIIIQLYFLQAHIQVKCYTQKMFSLPEKERISFIVFHGLINQIYYSHKRQKAHRDWVSFVVRLCHIISLTHRFYLFRNLQLTSISKSFSFYTLRVNLLKYKNILCLLYACLSSNKI